MCHFSNMLQILMYFILIFIQFIYFLVSFLISFLTHRLFIMGLFNFQNYGYLPEIYCYFCFNYTGQRTIWVNILCALEKNIHCLFGQGMPKISITSRQLIVLQKSSIFLLIFCVLVSQLLKEVLKSHIIVWNFSISPCGSIHFGFVYS